MNGLKFGQVSTPSDNLTASYTTLAWTNLDKSCKLTLYLTLPGSDEPVDKPGNTYSPQLHSSQGRSFDEVMEEVLEDRAEAWERLADL